MMLKLIRLIFSSMTHALAGVRKRCHDGAWCLVKQTMQQRRLQRHVYQLIAKQKWGAWLCQWWPSSPTYRQPWLLFIGASRSGKTSVIQQTFSPTVHLQNKEVHLFQARHAVCIEMVTPSPSPQSFPPMWRHLLLMARRYRRRQAFDALIWVIALPEILMSSDTDWSAQMKQWRRHIMTIKQTVKQPVPVYVLFTKLDALKHFAVFAQQTSIIHPLGFRLDESIDFQTPPQQIVAQQLERLYQSLTWHRIQAWQAVNQLDEPFAIYDFPEQFHQLQQRLQKWFAQWFASTGQVSLTGVFLGAYSGARQSIITRSRLRSTAFFVFTEQVTDAQMTFHESWNRAWRHELPVRQTVDAGLARLMHYGHARWLHYTFISLGLLCGVLWMQRVYQTVQTFLVEIDQTLRTIVQVDATTLALLPQTLIHHQQLMAQRRQRSGSQSLGLWHTDAFERRLTQAIQHKLQTTVLQRLPEQLITTLAEFHRQWPNLSDEKKIQQYPLYKAYFNLYQWLHHPSLHPVAQELWLVQALKQLLAMEHHFWPVRALRDVVRHYQFDSPKIRSSEDIFLLQQAQADLQTMALLPAAGYQWLRQGGKLLEEMAVTKMDPLDLPFFYTATGWQRWVRPMLVQILRDPWLVHLSHAQQQALGQRMITHYMEDFQQQWLQWLLNHWLIKTPSTFEQWSESVSAWLDVQKIGNVDLNALHQPLMELTRLMKRPSPPWDVFFAEQMRQSITAWQTLIDQLQQTDLWQPMYVQLLQPLMDLVTQWRTHPQPNQFAFQQIRQWRNNAQPLPWEQARQQLVTLLQRVPEVNAQRMMYQMLVTPIEQLQHWMTQQAKHYVTQQWQEGVLDYYQRMISDRFPFTAVMQPDTPDLSLKHFVQFLQPEQGMIWQFYQHYYLPLESLFPVDPLWQSCMRQLKQLSELLFNGVAATPQWHLEILPIPHPRLQELRWTHGSQQGRYQNEPQQWQGLHWPPQGAPFITGLSGRLFNEHWINSRSFEGVWGLFRLLATATIVPIDDQTLRVSWNLATAETTPLTVTWLLRSSDQTPALLTLLTTSWHFPSTVFSESPQ